MQFEGEYTDEAMPHPDFVTEYLELLQAYPCKVGIIKNNGKVVAQTFIVESHGVLYHFNTVGLPHWSRLLESQLKRNNAINIKDITHSIVTITPHFKPEVRTIPPLDGFRVDEHWNLTNK